MVTKRHMLTVMAGASCIMGSALQARDSWVSAMMQEMDRHEQEMQHFFDEMYSSFDDETKGKHEGSLATMDIAITPEKDAVKVTISAVDADTIEAAKNKDGSILTIKNNQGTLGIELSLEKNFLAVRAYQDNVVAEEETKEGTKEKEPKTKNAKPKASMHSAYSATMGQWLPDKVDLGASKIEFVRKEKVLTISIPKVASTTETVPVAVK